ncbi:MAG: M23 family metallopeptidase [Clostridia bacterium]
MKIRIKNVFNQKEDKKNNLNEYNENNELKFEKENKIVQDNLTKFKVYARTGASQKREKDSSFFIKANISKKCYFLMLAMCILGITSLALAAKTYNLFNSEDYEEYGSDVAVSSSIEEKPKDNINETQIEEIKVKESNKVIKNNVKPKSIPKEKVKTKPVVKVVPLSFSAPISGEISKIYSIDKVIYSKTLELWKTHEALDILADIGQSVKSIEKGIVDKIYDDAFYGITVVIDHGQGYKSSYSNLDKFSQVKEKQTVKKGQIVGKISNTAIGEIKDEPHLHFMLYKDNQVIDPTYIIK